MAYLSLLITVLVLMGASAAAVASVLGYRSRSASRLWLPLVLGGLASSCLAVFGRDVALVVSAPGLPPPGALHLLWSGIGMTLLVLALPRFVLSEFGGRGARWLSPALHATVAVTVGANVLRLVWGWNGDPVPDAVGLMLRAVVFLTAFLSLVSALAFQVRFAPRSGYRVLLAQIAVFAAFVPVLVAEDLGWFAVPGFPNSFLLLVTAAASLLILVGTGGTAATASGAGATGNAFGLSSREQEVARAVLAGQSNTEIGESLFISPRTVENHLHRIFEKTGAKNRLQLFKVLHATKEGDTPTE